jgi:hypothetical protein
MNAHGLPENTGIVTRDDFRQYPVVFCPEHPRGYMLLSRKGKAVSYRTTQGAKRYLLRTFGGPVGCPVHHKEF